MRITWQLPVHADRITRDEIPSDRNWSPFSGCCNSINDTATITHVSIRRTTKFETYQCTLEKWFQISKDKEKLRLGIRFLLLSEERMILKRVEQLRNFLSRYENLPEGTFLETENGFLRRLLSRIKASSKKLFIAPLTENQRSSNHFVASSKFSLIIHKDQNATSCNANM
ncbi:hypothetical protein V1478_008775 [Vespula squamosa]|uniref:Uncharacterized protein n=1 Tax=Vespula squamosa TaxID=30214 RepID=A0ABD2AUG2_VESSQ